MRVEMVKEKGNCRHTGREHWQKQPVYLKLLQMLCYSENSDSIVDV